MTRKTQKKLRKLLTLVGCAVLLVCVSVGATIAYLTSTTEVVQNTFTVGKVAITLDETDVDIYGKKKSDDRVTENDYKLLPGHTYTKDPTVTVKAGSEASYVRVMVSINEIADLRAIFGEDFQPQDFVNDTWNSTKWPCVSIVETNDTCVYEFRYFETVDTLNGEDLKLDALFSQIKMPEDVENEALATLEDLEINVVAHAIQADGFANVDAAWAAFDAE